MPIDLNRPLRWKTANALETSMLEDLQGNILKGHGRDHTRNLFVQFGREAEKSRLLVSRLGGEVTIAAQQLKDSELYRGAAKENAPPFLHLVLKASAYRKLEVKEAAIPPAPAFREGMRSRAKELLDPREPEFDPVCDALLIIGAHTSDTAEDEAVRLTALVTRHGGAVPYTQKGRALRNSRKDGIEHFGYVDGRSQPLMLSEDVEWERDERGGTSRWDPAFGPGLALVPDPGGHHRTSFGSYFVFRKLEQDVKCFKETEQKLADALGLGLSATDSDDREEARELAGALVVGRFEDGTAVVMSHEAEGFHPVWNNFNYDSDPDGITCPFASHIRKVNPRGDSVGRSHGTIEEERAHLFPRRGITYDDRSSGTQFALPSAGEADDPKWMAEAETGNAGRAAVMEGATEEETGSGHGDFPSKEVGLLFMCYNANIEQQFEFMQKSWANDPDYVKRGTGFDPIMGQGEGKLAQTWPAADGTPTPFGFGGFVRMLGGDYFFAPSISFLKGLAGV